MIRLEMENYNIVLNRNRKKLHLEKFTNMNTLQVKKHYHWIKEE